MHGIVFKSLKDYVVERRDHEAWDEVRAAAGLDRRVYLPVDAYDDDELYRLVDAVADLTGEATGDLLESYGRFAAVQFLETYGNVVRDDWDALDLVANAEERVHAVLRSHDSDLDPPELVCRRNGADQVTVVYRSRRRLCDVAKGIVLGVAEHYGEDLTVTEAACMHDDADRCEIVVWR